MGTWSGDWILDSVSATYTGYKVGKFSLKKKGGKYEVTSTGGATAAKWLGVVFTPMAGSGAPKFPWPMPAPPTSTQRKNGVEYIGEKLEELKRRGKKPFDSLQGVVPVGAVSKTVRLFKVDGATLKNPKTRKRHDFLVCIRQDALDGMEAGGQGGASGVRP